LGSRNRGSRRRHWLECSTWTGKFREVVHELRGREHERATQQCYRQDRDDQGPGRAHRATQDLGAKVREPRSLRLTPGSIVQGRQEDALVEVRGGAWDGQGSQETEHPGAAADLGGACGASLDMGRQARGISGEEVIEEEEVDELAGVRAVQGVRVRHITYMTRARQKVAKTLRA
jgi:hypothetical protein